jgi:Endonuclease/Exonuclease/phosphatase family
VGSIRVVWWNLENLFDTVDDPISRDFDFTPSEGWTPQAYKAKKQNLAAALNELHGGLGPELLGVAEVEGDQVFEELIAETGNTHLKVVKDPAGTSDLRGIDVSLAYDDRKLSVVDKHSHVVHLRYQTRDIFEVIFKVKDTNEELVVIASHWPSRRHGRLESEPLRIAVAENIAFLAGPDPAAEGGQRRARGRGGAPLRGRRAAVTHTLPGGEGSRSPLLAPATRVKKDDVSVRFISILQDSRHERTSEQGRIRPLATGRLWQPGRQAAVTRQGDPGTRRRGRDVTRPLLAEHRRERERENHRPAGSVEAAC